jgi:4-diphosphocytidyl-2-C-methyl-D-erythritol kinase
VNAVTVRVPAKVNVQLAVGGRRPDGYHDLANVFLAVAIHDEVTVEASDELVVTASGRDVAGLPLDAGNLAVRAAAALAERHGLGPLRLRLHITKSIPVAGGMAGGSADAAGALLACDTLWGLGSSREELLEICAEVGSDVPFSLVGGAALGVGRGELLTPLEVGGTFHWVFAPAPGGLSTPTVYRECDRLRRAAGGDSAADRPAPVADPGVLAALRSGDAPALAACLANDLQPAALSLRPALAATLEAGQAAGALAGIVSGSGPTCAFLAADADGADKIAATLGEGAMAATSPAAGATVLS